MALQKSEVAMASISPISLLQEDRLQEGLVDGHANASADMRR